MRKFLPVMNKENPRTGKKKKNRQKTKALRTSMLVSVPGPCDDFAKCFFLDKANPVSFL